MMFDGEFCHLRFWKDTAKMASISRKYTNFMLLGLFAILFH